MIIFINIGVLECFALIVLKCDYIIIACTKSTISYFQLYDTCIVDQEAMHFHNDADTYLYVYVLYSAQVAAFDPTTRHDC